ncbi:CcmD family protein [Calidifontibacillus erzurumensis]|uniref:CcmD family protein n=1 Tax=Calidifontibacillus erzurumensis TaxID=2741433 RepID=A0A8J8GB67_9BACI|nr:CcmD family protein [Calidifontibacillus erzurumensis]NSL50232.1 CcmD family protein [Calidifontibacillus erzurumensis]
MIYLFMAYTAIWVLISVYLIILGKRQERIVKQIEYIKELQGKQMTDFNRE